MLALIDHHDSFVHNLARYVANLGVPTQVFRYGSIDVPALLALQPSHVIFSPGPGAPDDVPISMAMVQALAGHVPLLGVCLGHQIIGQVYGAQTVQAKQPMHGMASTLKHDATALFARLPSPMQVGRYHSLVVDEKTLSPTMRIMAWSESHDIMAIAHATAHVYGVQFHPESVLTEYGSALLHNFLKTSSALSDLNTPAAVRQAGAQTVSEGGVTCL